MTAPVPVEELARVRTILSKLFRLVPAAGVVATGLVVGGALPAGASTGVLADDQFKWFYWIGFILAVSVLGMLAALAFGYYVKVIRPRMRGRRVS